MGFSFLETVIHYSLKEVLSMQIISSYCERFWNPQEIKKNEFDYNRYCILIQRNLKIIKKAPILKIGNLFCPKRFFNSSCWSNDQKRNFMKTKLKNISKYPCFTVYKDIINEFIFLCVIIFMNYFIYNLQIEKGIIFNANESLFTLFFWRFNKKGLIFCYILFSISYVLILLTEFNQKKNFFKHLTKTTFFLIFLNLFIKTQIFQASIKILRGIDNFTSIINVNNLLFFKNFLLLYSDRILFFVILFRLSKRFLFFKISNALNRIFFKLLQITFIFFVFNGMIIVALSFFLERSFKQVSNEENQITSFYETILVVYEFIFGSIIYIKPFATSGKASKNFNLRLFDSDGFIFSGISELGLGLALIHWKHFDSKSSDYFLDGRI